MFGWHELPGYHPLIALVGGFAAFYALRGVGRTALMAMDWAGVRASTVRHLTRPLELIFGVLIVGLCAQVAAIAGVSTPGVAQGMAALMFLAGVSAVIADARDVAHSQFLRSRRGSALAWWIPAAIVALSLLAAAIAPESRSDETAYHAIVTARILEDGGLRVHTLPWEATIWPQMTWHFAMVPVFVTVGSAAARVVAFGTVMLLALTIADIVRFKLGSESLAALSALGVVAGGYPVAILVTLGPHAFGYIATFTACYAAVQLRPTRSDPAPGSGAPLVGIACAGMIAGKVTMLPLAAIVMLMSFWQLGRRVSVGERLKIATWLIAPATIAFAPILIWGWIAAHSPLGVMTADLLHSPVFDSEARRVYQGTRELFADLFLWRFELSYWNGLLATGVIAAILVGGPDRSRGRYALLLFVQIAVIILALPKEIRHLGGLQYALFAGGLCAVIPRLRLAGIRETWISVGALVLTVPWVGLGLYVASVYAPLAAGLQTPTVFLQRYSGLFQDYEHLDQMLPADAELLMGYSATSPTQYAWYARPPIFYAPRPVMMNAGELHPAHPVYLLYIGADAPDPTRGGAPIRFDPVLPPGFMLGRNVYSNARSQFYPSRTPRSSAGTVTRLDVYELLRTSVNY